MFTFIRSSYLTEFFKLIIEQCPLDKSSEDNWYTSKRQILWGDNYVCYSCQEYLFTCLYGQCISLSRQPIYEGTIWKKKMGINISVFLNVFHFNKNSLIYLQCWGGWWLDTVDLIKCLVQLMEQCSEHFYHLHTHKIMWDDQTAMH